MHLPRQPNRDDARRRDLGCPQDLLDGAHRRSPPVLGLLLGPTRAGRGERVALRRGALDAPLLVDERRLDGARADVDSQKDSQKQAPTGRALIVRLSVARRSVRQRAYHRRAGKSDREWLNAQGDAKTLDDSSAVTANIT